MVVAVIGPIGLSRVVMPAGLEAGRDVVELELLAAARGAPAAPCSTGGPRSPSSRPSSSTRSGSSACRSARKSASKRFCSSSLPWTSDGPGHRRQRPANLAVEAFLDRADAAEGDPQQRLVGLGREDVDRAGHAGRRNRYRAGRMRRVRARIAARPPIAAMCRSMMARGVGSAASASRGLRRLAFRRRGGRRRLRSGRHTERGDHGDERGQQTRQLPRHTIQHARCHAGKLLYRRREG